VQWKGKVISAGNDAATPEAVAPETIGEPSPEAASIDTPNSSSELQQLQRTVDDACSGIEEMYAMLTRLAERDTTNEKVFNMLHAELGDYKKDFIYEHLKPVIRPLLFLYDSLEGFEGEIAHFEGTVETSRTSPGQMPTTVVKQNVVYFREQLVEALRICEVTPMDTPEGAFNPRFHKAVAVEKVEPEANNTIVRPVRSGWFLNGQLLRPAEVVVGKAAAKVGAAGGVS
jgi:molecular chaperone GrpE (heat shock protein)